MLRVLCWIHAVRFDTALQSLPQQIRETNEIHCVGTRFESAGIGVIGNVPVDSQQCESPKHYGRDGPVCRFMPYGLLGPIVL